MRIPCHNPACRNTYHYNKTCPLLTKKVKVPCTNTTCRNRYHYDKECPKTKYHDSSGTAAAIVLKKKPHAHRLQPTHGHPLPPDIYVAANAIHTSPDKCSTGSWLAWTRKHNKGTSCMIAGCPGDAAVGGHVLIQNFNNTSYYFIIPLCRVCNASGGYLDYDWRKTRKCAPVACRWHESVPRDGNRIADVKPGRRARFPK